MTYRENHTATMFSRIAKRYDLLNGVLSGGLNTYWRNQLVKLIPIQANHIHLDVASGTGDIIKALMKSLSARNDNTTLLGCDPSQGMLHLARERLPGVEFTQGAAESLPYPSESVHSISIAYGIRNFEQLDVSFKELHRVLRPQGTLSILEFSMPSNNIIKYIYLVYFRKILPKIAKCFGQDEGAYRYLNESVEQFPPPSIIYEKLHRSGFKTLRGKSLTFGVAHLYHMQKT